MSYENRRCLLFFAVLFIFSSFAAKSASALPNTDLQKLLEQVDKIRQLNNVPAVGMVIVKHGEIEWQGSLGELNVINHTKADENTFYRVGSITKAFTSLVLLKLQEQGKLKLTDKLSDYVATDYFQNPWAQTHPVTIEQLLEHTAGFTDISSAEFDYDNPNAIILSDGLAFNGEYHQVRWQPGQHSSYSNLDAGLAGAVIEKVTGTNYDDYLTQSLLIPLGMEHSSTLLTDYVKENIATGYDSSGSDESGYWHIILRPFGALNSSPKEMGNFIKLLVNRGRINGQQFLSEATIERMENPRTTLAAMAGLNFGYGLGNYHTEYNGFDFHGHSGMAYGYLARFDYLLQNKSGYAVMINSSNQGALNEINKAIRDYLIADLVPPKVLPDQPLTADINQYLGYYQPVTSRARLSLFIERLLGVKKLSKQGEHLLFGSFLGIGEPSILSHQGHNFYRVQGYSFADIALIRADDGKIFLQNDANYQRISTASFYFQSGMMLSTLALILLSLCYLLMIIIKQLYRRKLPEGVQRQRLLIASPFLLLVVIIGLLILFPMGKGTLGASVFNILGAGLLLVSVVALGFAVLQNYKRNMSVVYTVAAWIGLTMTIYLYYWGFIGQPIWS